MIHDRLDKLNGEAFGRAYIAAQIVDHQKTAQLLAWEISFGEDAEMQRFAGSMLPIVLDHLRQAQEINAALSRAGTGFCGTLWQRASTGLSNAVELFAGSPVLRSKAAASLAKKAHAVLVAAGYNPAAPSKWTIDISSGRFATESGIKADQQST